jgi:ketosteroid isomerase-like protein
MTEQPIAVAVRRNFEAWNSGRVEFSSDYLTEDVVLHFAGNNAMSGTYRGRDAVMDALARARQGWGAQTEVESVLASDDHVMVFHHPIGEHDRRHYDSGVVAYKLDAAGKVVEAWFLANDQQGFDKFWS